MEFADNERPARGPKRRTIIITEPARFPEENLSTFVHTILITTITSGEQHPNESCAIHHWDHPITALRRSVVIPTGLSIESLSYIEGFRKLGRFKQPQSRVSPQETHDYLSLLIRETPVALCPTGDDAESHQVAILRLVRRLEERTKKIHDTTGGYKGCAIRYRPGSAAVLRAGNWKYCGHAFCR